MKKAIVSEIGPVRIARARSEGIQFSQDFETFVLEMDHMTHSLNMAESYARKLAQSIQDFGQSRELIMYLGRACVAQGAIERLPSKYHPMKVLSRELLMTRLGKVTKLYRGRE